MCSSFLVDIRTVEVLFVDEKSPIRPFLRIMDTKEVIQLANYLHIFIDEHCFVKSNVKKLLKKRFITAIIHEVDKLHLINVKKVLTL